MDKRVKLAAMNNAIWCDSVCRAHGLATDFTDKVWICHGIPPRFYSHLVTLSPDAAEAVEKVMPPGFKDGFFDIDFSPHGYSCLFEATWIWMDSNSTTRPNLDWRRMGADETLLEWERAWAMGDEDAGNHPRQFPSSLLSDPNIAFMAGFQDGDLEAGCILNLTGSVVGLSNVFGIGLKGVELWRDLQAVANRQYPGLGVVGYERGDPLSDAVTAGFDPLAQLRVWVQ